MGFGDRRRRFPFCTVPYSNHSQIQSLALGWRTASCVVTGVYKWKYIIAMTTGNDQPSKDTVSKFPKQPFWKAVRTLSVGKRAISVILKQS